MHGAGETNYSTTSEEMLCKTCKFGQVVESSQGGTAVICHCTVNGTENTIPRRLDMLVTKCNRYELPQLLRLWDTALSVHNEDGHCWMSDPRYRPNLGHVHQRVDTVGQRLHVYKEHPGRTYDITLGHFTDEKPPMGSGVAKWWRRVWPAE